MQTTWAHMFGHGETYALNKMQAFVFDAYGSLMIETPGNACGINADWDCESGKGYEFSSHNVGSPAQQLSLLVGLATLHDLVRQDTIEV